MNSQSPASAAPPPFALIFMALAPFAAGYFLSYLFRAVNAVVAPDLVRDVGLTAGELGLLTAAYLLAFALFQLPLGILLDRFGPRRVQAVLVAIGAFGAALFALGESALTLTLARAIIGLGFAGGLMSGFKAVVIWVPESRRALANAFVMSLGALGLLIATTPLELAVQAYGWRMVFWALAAVTLGVALLILAVVPERDTGRAPGSLKVQVGELGRMFHDRAFLALAPLLAISAGTHIAIQTLWAGPWFRDVAGFDRLGVANSLLAMAAAFFVGILFTGALADWLTRRGFSLLDVMLATLMLFLAAQVGILLEIKSAALVFWTLFGMSGQVAILAYPWLSSHFGAALSGRANTAMNLLLFLTAFASQYLIGAIIDLFPAPAGGGYAPVAYQVAFGVFFALQLAALAWFAVNRARLGEAERQFAAKAPAGQQ